MIQLTRYKNKLNSILHKEYEHETPDIPRSKEFAQGIKGLLKHLFPNATIKIIETYCSPSAFLTFEHGQTIYVSFNDYRWREWDDGILYRTAQNDTDYHGGYNNFASLDALKEDIEHLLLRERSKA